LPILVVESHHRILICDVELGSDQCQPIRSIEIRGECVFHFISAVAIRIAKQGKAIATFGWACPLCLDPRRDYIFGRELRGTTSSSFRDQDVSVRQNQGLARDLEVGRYCRDDVARRHYGFAIAPFGGLRYIHRRQQLPLRIRERRRGPVLSGIRIPATAGG
jgi:hypothetical protein